MNNNVNILISDANHGGLILLDEYSKISDRKIFFYDTYDKLSCDEKSKLECQYDVCFVNLDYVRDNIDKLITIQPVHMKPLFRCDYTHHEFTGYLINKHRKRYGWDFKVIEVTGVKGKTTTVNIISDFLCEFNVLSLTSEGLVYKARKTSTIMLDDSLSITPASIIVALNMAVEYGIIHDIDFFICEVSLGISTNVDVGVLTNIVENYSIAGGFSDACNAKKSVFKARNIICDMQTFNKYYSNQDNLNISLISLDDMNADVYMSDVNYSLKGTEITVNNKYIVKCFALSDFYVKNILTAISTVLKLGLSWDDILRNVRNIKTIKGRGSYKMVDDKLIFEDVNPGLNTTSIRNCIDSIKKYSDNYVIILGGDYGITCEEIDEDKLIQYIKRLDSTPLILVGMLGESLNNKLNSKYHYYSKLKDAYEDMLESEYDIIQIIYRSEYNNCVDY